MTLKFELRSLDFRKESFPVYYHYYLCKDRGEQFTTTELDELNLNQVYNQYREKHKLPFPEEIISIREKYGLPASKMSEILGFGINTYRNYENGEVPSQANARLIQLAEDPVKFKELVELWDKTDTFKMKLIHKLEKMIAEEEKVLVSYNIEDYLLGESSSNEYTGYKLPDLKKFAEMVIFFSEKLEPFKTKMNKLLFYADFLCYKKTGLSMSGIRYRAIDMGPVPNNFNSIFEYLANKDEIDIWITQLNNGYEGEQFKKSKKRKLNLDLFNETELQILNQLAEKFKNRNASQIVEFSHKEKAWKENEKERKVISYKNYAFDLSI